MGYVTMIYIICQKSKNRKYIQPEKEGVVVG